MALATIGAGCSNRPPVTTPPEDPTAIFGRLPDEPVPPAPRPEGVFCGNEYYPLKPGYGIRYRTTFPAADGVTGQGAYSFRVTNVENDVAKIETVVESSDGSQPPIRSTQSFGCENDALKALAYVDVGSRVTGAASANKFKIETTEANGVFLPRRVRLGDSWVSHFKATLTPQNVTKNSPIRQPMSVTVDIERGAEAVETVRVPAGTYTAVRLRVNTSINGIESMSGTEWWVEGVGMVKSAFDAGSGVKDILSEATSVTVPR